jgi:hypothetical protein
LEREQEQGKFEGEERGGAEAWAKSQREREREIQFEGEGEVQVKGKSETGGDSEVEDESNKRTTASLRIEQANSRYLEAIRIRVHNRILICTSMFLSKPRIRGIWHMGTTYQHTLST